MKHRLEAPWKLLKLSIRFSWFVCLWFQFVLISELNYPKGAGFLSSSEFWGKLKEVRRYRPLMGCRIWQNIEPLRNLVVSNVSNLVYKQLLNSTAPKTKLKHPKHRYQNPFKLFNFTRWVDPTTSPWTKAELWKIAFGLGNSGKQRETLETAVHVGPFV